MNPRIKELLAEYNAEAGLSSARLLAIDDKLRAACREYFDADKRLDKICTDAESASEYQLNRHGEIEAWFYAPELKTLIAEECRDYFDDWVQDGYCLRVDWTAYAGPYLLRSEGDSLIIQDDTPYGHDNGVWFNHKRIIEESSYTNEEGEVSEDERNVLIEQWMAKNGYFPGVFRVTRYGDVFPVNTQKKG